MLSFVRPTTGLVALVACACSSPRAPGLFVRDGAVLEDGSLTASSASPCLPDGADTLIAGPEVGCVSAVIEAEGETGLVVRGARPLRVVDRTPPSLSVEVVFELLCESDEEFSLFFLETECDRGTSIQGRCNPGVLEREHIPFDVVEGGHDGVLEMYFAGNATARFSACVVGR